MMFTFKALRANDLHVFEPIRFPCIPASAFIHARGARSRHQCQGSP